MKDVDAGRLDVRLLHDLAFLYLELAHGADHDLDYREQRTIAAKLRQWQPYKNPKLIDHVIREATLSYLEKPSDAQMDALIDKLAKALPEALREHIISDLKEIAQADGEVLAAEERFIGRIARVWGDS